MHTFRSLLLNLCLCKANTCLYPEDGMFILPLPTVCPKLCNKFLLSLSFIVSLYLVYQGEWMDPACGILGVWALNPKLSFQFHYVHTV
jgi:hypothetical protein